MKPAIDAGLAHRRCPGPKLALEASAITARGHKLSQAEGDLSILFCVDCGAYSARRAYGLGGVCRGTPTRAGAQALARIRKGLQPWQSRHDAGQPRPRLGAMAAWSRGHGSFVDARGGQTHGRRGGGHEGRDIITGMLEWCSLTAMAATSTNGQALMKTGTPTNAEMEPCPRSPGVPNEIGRQPLMPARRSEGDVARPQLAEGETEAETRSRSTMGHMEEWGTRMAETACMQRMPSTSTEMRPSPVEVAPPEVNGK